MSKRVVIGFTVACLVLVTAVLAFGPNRRTGAGVARLSANRQATFGSHGGEAERGNDSPAAQEVANRAYPRNYVDDRNAETSRKAYTGKPSSLDRSAFRSDKTYQAALANAPTLWKALGPVTPNVPGEPSQFFDPATQTGPTTQESGRVTALAIDPNCGKASAPSGAACRLWVAAAGGGIWRTNNALAAKPAWIAPPNSLPTNAFGSLTIDPNDPSGNTLYAGSGEPNGSGDSEAGLGLFKTTNGGQSWTLLAGSQSAALNRSIGAILIPKGAPNTIYIGTDVARHGSASVNGGRRTPPDAPDLGVYKSTNGGASFTFEVDLHNKTPQNPTDPGAGTGTDWFQGGITKLEADPNNASSIYAGIFGYGLWRSNNTGTTWSQVFHTINQTDFTTGAGDTFGDRTEFDLVDLGSTTRAYLGDASDDLGVAEVWRTNNVAAISGDPNGAYDNAGWTKLSDSTNGTNGFLADYYCQNGQCGYDDFVTSPGAQLGVGAGHEDELWLGGSMNYDELPAYAGQPLRSNGRAVIRSTNADDAAADVTWQDMSATIGSGPTYPFTRGIHPDQHAVVFASANPDIAFVGSDGGVVRIDVRTTRDKSAACNTRGLAPLDLLDCQRLLSAIPALIVPINDGLNTIQFQSLSVNPDNPTGSLLGGTQDNGTWAYTGSPTWFESVGGDGGQSGFDAGNTAIRYHNYFDATPEVNFHGNDPKEWLAIYDPVYGSSEARSFYVPFIADPNVAGRAFIGLQHVWRTNDNGGDPAFLEAKCNALHRAPLAPNESCGDWKPIGDDLTGTKFGQDRLGHYVVATVRAPSDDGTMWAGTRIGRLFVSNDVDAANGVKFHRIDTPSTPGRFVSGITIDPSDPNHAWVSYTGYSAYTPTTPGHVFDVHYDPATHSATFTSLDYNLGDIPVTGIARFDATGDLYISTDWGILRLPNGATAWQKAGAGFPRVATYGLTLTEAGHTLFAATHGRGAWGLNLPS
ncbi:MAG TPA: hypothetical protein VKA30_07580 [Actinomycetota bacterium]|nr:hypothetical protein [Actinomycetota bacterium]